MVVSDSLGTNSASDERGNSCVGGIYACRCDAVRESAVRESAARAVEIRVGAMALVTAFLVAARGSHADSAGPGATGPHSAHGGGSSAPPQPPRAGERFLAVRKQDSKPPGLGRQRFGRTGAAGAEGEGSN